MTCLAAAPALVATCCLLLAFALLVLPDRPRIPGPARQPKQPNAAGSPWRRAGFGAAGVAGAGMALFPGFWLVVLAGALGVGALLARQTGGGTPADRAARRSLIAVFAELFAACLDAGMATGPALQAVGEVLAEGPGDTAERGQRKPTAGASAGPLAILGSVAAMLSLGADPGTAWGVADLDHDLAPIAAAARRSAAGGAGLAEAVREHAAALRRDAVTDSARAAARAGVLMTAPLGICFLPAFLCLGLAPVVVGLLGKLNIF